MTSNRREGEIREKQVTILLGMVVPSLVGEALLAVAVCAWHSDGLKGHELQTTSAICKQRVAPERSQLHHTPPAQLFFCECRGRKCG